jgi:glycerol uptake facilitator-like aquaporin
MLLKKLFAEFLGTAVLVATVVGSGIMATNLSADLGVALLINTVATVFVLYILITLLAPISGAHFNPLVSGIAYFRKELSAANTFYFFIAQILGGSLGAILANLMFEHPAIEPSQHVRNGSHLLLGEVIASAGLIFIAVKQGIDKKIPRLVAAWIGAAYFFTSSTSFANPAVTIARGLTDSFSGIKFSSVPGFIAAQIVGAILGYSGFKFITSKAKSGK